MKNEWFEWERESTIHPLFLTLESGMTALKPYFGESWPDTILIFRGPVVLWCNKVEDLRKLGERMIDHYLEEKNLTKMLFDLDRETKRLRGNFSKIDALNLSGISDAELLNTYEELRKSFLDWFAIGWLVEPVAIQGEHLTLKKTQDKKAISVLTSTTKDSFSKRGLMDLLRIAQMKKDGKDIEKALAAHAKKYFWIQNNYFKTRILDKAFFEGELKNVIGEYPEPKKYLLELDEMNKKTELEKEKTMDLLGFNQKDRKLFELLDLFGWFQDYRKEYTMQFCHYLDLVLAEIGKRNSYSAWEMKYTLPADIKPIIGKKFDKCEIEKRMKNCIIVWDKGKKNYELYVGEIALQKEKGLFKASDVQETIEISGMVASPGKVEGKVRVTMSADDAKDILEGEILVTSMTSPDFVVAMKKAAAVVTNEGGITCHAAIIAREFGIPCVVGTKIATKVFKTGDLIEVNANHGFVRKIARKN